MFFLYGIKFNDLFGLQDVFGLEARKESLLLQTEIAEKAKQAREASYQAWVKSVAPKKTDNSLSRIHSGSVSDTLRDDHPANHSALNAAAAAADSLLFASHHSATYDSCSNVDFHSACSHPTP